MHLFFSSLLLTLVLEQAPGPEGSNLPAACPDRQRLELSLQAPSASTEVCISSGGLTGFVFDQPASVDLQEEVRFARVLRGRSGISFLPPPDLAPGERLRLTIHFEKDPPEQAVAVMLVSSPGQVTHQVDVFHDSRSRESLRQEVEEAWAKNQRLLEENRALLARLKEPVGLLRFYRSGELGPWGVRFRTYRVEGARASPNSFEANRGSSYRSLRSVGVKMSLSNEGDEPWTVVGVRMSGSKGEKLEGVNFSFSAQQTLCPHCTGTLFVEAKVGPEAELSGLTVTLEREGGRSLSVEDIPLP